MNKRRIREIIIHTYIIIHETDNTYLYKGKFFLIAVYQILNVEGMTKLEKKKKFCNHHSIN